MVLDMFAEEVYSGGFDSTLFVRRYMETKRELMVVTEEDYRKKLVPEGSDLFSDEEAFISEDAANASSLGSSPRLT